MSVSYGNALTIIGGLSQPSKMPWWGWSISAEKCVTGSRLAQREDTVCSGCYALKGRYLFPNVKGAHERRLAAATHPDFVEAFVVVLHTLYTKTRKVRADGRIENRFRWFDSGDLQSVDMLEKINEIAKRTPQIDHWLPTRETGMVRRFLDVHKTLADNLVVRISLPQVGVTAARQPLGLPFASVGSDDQDDIHQCQAAALQGNRCLDCDACWGHANVNYPLH